MLLIQKVRITSFTPVLNARIKFSATKPKKFENERDRLFQCRGGKKFKVLPDDLKQLSIESNQAGIVNTLNYKIEYDEEKKPTLYKRGSKTISIKIMGPLLP